MKTLTGTLNKFVKTNETLKIDTKVIYFCFLLNSDSNISVLCSHISNLPGEFRGFLLYRLGALTHNQKKFKLNKKSFET